MLLRASAVMLHGHPLFPVVPGCVHAPRLHHSMALPEAVDFHCEPAMLHHVASLHRVSPGSVKDAIWHNSSKCNVREEAEESPPARQLWEQIRADVQEVQHKRLRRSL